MADITISPYEVLELQEGATLKDVKRQYKRLIRVHSPESSPEQFMRVRKAYDAINNKNFTHEKFSFYQKPLEFLDEIRQQSQESDVNISILKEVFESPFNTNYELQQLIKKDG